MEKSLGSKPVSRIPLWSLLLLPFLPFSSYPVWVPALDSFNGLQPINQLNPFFPRLPLVIVFFCSRRKKNTTLFDSCSLLTSKPLLVMWTSSTNPTLCNSGDCLIWPLFPDSLMSVTRISHMNSWGYQRTYTLDIPDYLLLKDRRCFIDLKAKTFQSSSADLCSSTKQCWKWQMGF